MSKRLELHSELAMIVEHVYFQPPSNLQLQYPCIIYTKSDKNKNHANDNIYSANQGYQITVIDKNPDSLIPDFIENYFQYCSITNYFSLNGLHHTILNLYY